MGTGHFLRKSKSRIYALLQGLFRLFGLGVTSHINLVNLQGKAALVDLNQRSLDRSKLDIEFIRTIKTSNYESLINLLGKSKSQLRQDLFVLSETNFKRGGYFVEFGATNGIDLNNTYLLETEFSWKGILAEPARVWKKELLHNRPNSSIETLCVWKDSNSKLVFNETDVPELSTIDLFSKCDEHKSVRDIGHKYEVTSISMLDLLDSHHAPKYIDYLSIDTEGSEYEILNAFDFSRYSFGIITVEHNETSQRELIFRLLTSFGYKRKYTSISHFDDWYTR